MNENGSFKISKLKNIPRRSAPVVLRDWDNLEVYKSAGVPIRGTVRSGIFSMGLIFPTFLTTEITQMKVRGFVFRYI